MTVTMSDDAEFDPGLAGCFFAARVVATSADDSVTFKTLTGGSGGVHVDFGDGQYLDLPGDDRRTDLSHRYAPGEYWLTMRGSGGVLGADVFLDSRPSSAFGRAVHTVVKYTSGFTSRTFRFGSSSLSRPVPSLLRGVERCDYVCADGLSRLDCCMERLPRVLHIPNVTGLYGSFSADELESPDFWMFADGKAQGAFEALIAPRWPVGDVPQAFRFCPGLKEVYIPKCTRIPKHFTGGLTDGLHIYTGRLTSVSPLAFVSASGALSSGCAPLSVSSDQVTLSEGPSPSVHLHVPMGVYEFLPLVSDRTCGAVSLTVHCSDGVIADDGITDLDGNWMGLYHEGATYMCDAQGRRIDGSGHYLNWAGEVVSDCGRRCTSDGDYIDIVDGEWGDLVDFYGDLKYERRELPSGWLSSHPDYASYAQDMQQFYYVRPSEGDPEVDAWYFYDARGYRLFVYIPEGS